MPNELRVGILDDLTNGPPSPTDIGDWLHRAVDDLAAAGSFVHPVTFVPAYGLGLPTGSADAVERAFAELVDAGVVLVVGPAIGDNALVATPLAEAHRVPTVNWAGTEAARGDWMFHLQVGSHEDEAILLARHLAATGVRRIGVVHDRSPIGDRYAEFLLAEAARLGLDVVAVDGLAPLADDAGAPVGAVLDARPDALVHLGLGLATPAVARAAAAQGWRGPCLTNSSGLRGYDPEYARLIDGWTYVDLHADDNRTLLAVRERFGIPAGRATAAAKGWDLGRLVAEGLARAPEPTRAGVRAGLERVKWLPAAEGHEGTVLGFGHHDRGALHGRYLVLRRWTDGISVQIDTP